MATCFRWIAAVAALVGILLGGGIPQTGPEPRPQVVMSGEGRDPREDIWARAAAQTQPEAGCVFVYDPALRQMLYCSTDPEERLYPASVTKLFTAWVALGFLSADETVTVGWELGLLESGSSQAFLALDSRLTVEELLQGMLLPSGNDAALVLAAAVGRKIAGDKKITAAEAVDLFVEEMNLAAEAAGMENTHFENPHGCHWETHYSCPRDLGLMAALALEEPLIRKTVALSRVTVTARTGQIHTWSNTNALVRQDASLYCPQALGLKTGYTDAAGHCLLAAFDGESPIVVGVFGCGDSDSRYTAALELYRSAKEMDIQTAPLHGKIEQRSREK